MKTFSRPTIPPIACPSSDGATVSVPPYVPDEGPQLATDCTAADGVSSFAKTKVPSEVPEEFEHFVEDHYQAAYRFAFRLSGNHNDACDITQQAFYLAHTHSHQLRDASKRKQWLFSILHREFLSTRRRDIAHPEISLEFCEQVLPHISVDHATTIDGKTLLLVLQDLDDNFKAPIVLFYLEQLSYKEIAATLNVPIGTVMSRLARGKVMLREQLEKNRISIPSKPSQVRFTSEGSTDG